jgi:hypothetical protein
MTSLVFDGPRDEEILLRWTDRLGIYMPCCEQLMQRWAATYREVLVAPSAVPEVRGELDRLRAAVEARRTDELIVERQIRARDPAVRTALVQPLLDRDPDTARLREIVAACDAAIAAGQPILWGGE